MSGIFSAVNGEAPELGSDILANSCNKTLEDSTSTLEVIFDVSGNSNEAGRKGCALLADTPFSLERERVGGLEREAHCPLYLTLLKDGIAGRGLCTEAGKRYKGRSRNVKSSAIDIGHMGSVEQVKALNQEFEIHVLREPEPSRESHVNIHNFRLLEAIATKRQEVTITARSSDAVV